MTRRRSLMTRIESGGRLPAAYQEAKYIQSTGSQYIATNFKFQSSSNIRLLTKVNVQTIADRRLFGYFNGSGNLFVIQSRGTNNIEIAGKVVTNIITTADTDYTLDIQIANSVLSVNGTDHGAVTGSVNGNTVYILGAKWSGSPNPAYAKMYYLTAYEDGMIVCDFVPCYRKSDSEAGMYDLVSGTFYTNAGTGTFVVGPDVN